MIVFPNAKINLGLHVTGKRPDGYHSIETVLLPVGLCDALEAVEHTAPHNSSSQFASQSDTTDRFTLSGIPIPDDGQPNLCMQAVHLFREHLQRENSLPQAHGNSFPEKALSIHLHKHIPAGSGLGGGSSDAAFMLRLLNELSGADLDMRSHKELAATLGSDCPFFLSDGPALASGRGEILHPIELPALQGLYLALVVPPIHVSTAGAYAGVKPVTPAASLREILSHPTETWKEKLVNDFEEHIFARHPMVRDIKQALYGLGALYASMSGSGSAVYGVFRESQVPSLGKQLRSSFPDSFTWTGQALP
jgi:4-diphosphocytidyl-2-C-methyl-D-erythritol kinase